MSTVEYNIEKALFNRINELVLVPALPIAWPNLSFPGVNAAGVPLPKPAKYISVQHFRNRPDRVFLDGAEPSWRVGFLQLTVVTRLDSGAPPNTEVAGQVALHFPADLQMSFGGTTVSVSEAPYVGDPSKGDVSWDVPVTVYYESFA